MKPQIIAYLMLGCVAALVAAAVSILGLPYGRMEYTAFAELYHNGTDTSGKVHVALDCDPVSAGTQDYCSYNAQFPPATIDVAVTLGNSTGATFVLGPVDFFVINPDQTRLDASAIDNPGDQDDNPDFDQASVTGSWSCGSPPPDDDKNPGPPEDSFLSCVNSVGNGPAVVSGPSHLRLATVRYDTIVNPTPGNVSLSLQEVAVYDDSFSEVGSCHPIIDTLADCFGATIEFLSSPGCPGDHDCDGYNDPPPPGHPGPRNTNPNYDNCFIPPNADQNNTDGNFYDHSPPYVPGVDDRTRAQSDTPGDRCDPDMDNDGLPGDQYAAEAPCNGSGTPDRLKEDTDGDRVLDGAECAMGSNPTDPLSGPAAPLAADDPDHDRLSTAFEISINTDPDDVDTDNDGLQDGWEFKGYNSNPLSIESDGDGIKDGCEVASLNGDTVVNPGDQALLTAEIIRPVQESQKLANMDLNKDGALNPGDQAFQASLAMPGKCP